MATYGVDPKNLIDTGDELRSATKAVGDALDALNTAVGTYSSSNAGATADAFHAAQADWQAGVQEMNTALTTGATALDNISHTYVEIDNKGAQSF
jgi:WXG100 family type VII secretion target